MNLLKTGKICVCEEQKSKGTVAVARSKKAVKYKKAGLQKSRVRTLLKFTCVFLLHDIISDLFTQMRKTFKTSNFFYPRKSKNVMSLRSWLWD